MSDVPTGPLTGDDDGARTVTLTVPPEAAGERLDRFLASRLADLSRSRVQALIDSGAVRVGDRPARPATRLLAGDVITVSPGPSEPDRLRPEPIPLDVVYEDSNLLVVNKPAGLVVHPAPGHGTGTLVNALVAHYPPLAGAGDDMRPGIVHRLDKDTSGLMVVAKHGQAQRMLAAQLKQRQMDKRYLALVEGTMASASGTIDAPIARDPRRPQQMGIVAGGREAITCFRVLEQFPRHTLLECKPVTGRTHQIRVHLAAIGHPIVADTMYGYRTPTLPLARQFLHAARLTFRLPSGETRTFEAPLPDDLQQALTRLRATPGAPARRRVRRAREWGSPPAVD